jgi:magnesium transporter
MKAENPLTREYLMSYPAEAARVLEQVSAEHVAALLAALSPPVGTPLLAALMPASAVTCLAKMEPLQAAKWLTELAPTSAARIFRLLSNSQQEEISANLVEKSRRLLQRQLEYPMDSVGALLNPRIDMLPNEITVGDTLHRIERLGRSVNNEIYIIDAEHHLVGVLDSAKLLTSKHSNKLRDIMNSKTQSLLVHANAAGMMHHPGWKTQRRLPVVDRDNTLLGALDYQHLQEMVEQRENTGQADPLENLISLASLYWLSVAQLLDSLLSTSGQGKGK